MASSMQYVLLRYIIIFIYLTGKSFSISQNSTLFEQSSFSSFQNISTFAETSETNYTWTRTSHEEIIYSPQNTLIRVAMDQLPLEYWVPVKPKLKYWPNKTIATEIGKGFTYPEIRTIWDALEAMSESIGACIRFVRKTPYEKDFLHFKKGRTCDSRIGYKGGRHIVKLSTGCLDPEELGAIQHEVLHALGFFHEHSRTDRDDFVEVNWENVQPGDKRDFKKLKFHTFNLPYDYTSLMHYASDAYAINEDVPTLLPKKPAVNITTMGQRIGLSQIDVKRLRMPYKCDDPQADLSRNVGQNRNIFQRTIEDDDDTQEEESMSAR